MLEKKRKKKKELAFAMKKANYLDHIPTPVLAIDKTYTITYINNAGGNFLNIEKEKCIGQKCYELIKTSHCNTDNCRCRIAMAKEQTTTGETTVFNGTPIRYTATPVKDEKGEIIGALEHITDISNEIQVTKSVLEISEAIANGELDKRADEELFEGNYKDIVKGMNQNVDQIAKPLHLASQYLGDIAAGNIPEQIQENYNGDYGNLKNGINLLISNISDLLVEMNTMSNQHNEGDIDWKMPIDKFKGSYKQMADGLNKMVEGHINVKKKAMACVEQFGQGNFEAELEKFPGKKAFINDIIEQLRENLKGFINEMNTMSSKHDEGDIDWILPVEKFSGDFGVMADG